MISCTEFIPAYSELFNTLERLGDKEAVVELWHYISDNYLTKLRDLVAERGLQGCWDYWTEALNEEAADFTLEMDLERGIYMCHMHRCPSKGRLLELKHIEPYRDYCDHCRVLYERVLEPLGFEYVKDASECDHARCKGIILKKEI
jgi:hypothetical protein